MNTKNNIAATVGTRSRASVIWRTAFAAAAFCVATASSPSFAASLTHRWSFNGTTDAQCLADSVGNANATKMAKGNITWSDGRAVYAGGGGAGYLNLGTGVIDTDDATLEFWVTPGTQSAWSYMFTYGLCDSDDKNLFTVSWSRERNTENDRLARNELNLIYNGTSYDSGEQKFGTFVPGVPYHFSMTFKKSGGDTTLRLMSRNVATGAILSERTVTIPGWTTATAAANGWALTLGHNPWKNSDFDNVATYDDVRIWNGVLSDEQIAAGVVAGPDVILGGRTTSDSAGFDIAAGSSFTIGKSGMFWTSGTVGIGAGASIVFDTANYSGTEMKFVTGGFTLPAGASSVLDFVTLTDSDNYTASVDGDTIVVSSVQPAYAKWTGASAPASAADLANSANWTCYGKDGTTVVSGVPGGATTLLIDGTTSFSLPAGVLPTWGSVLVGGHSATMKAKRAGSPGNFSSAWIGKAISEYNTNVAQTEITHLYRSTSAGNSPSEMANSLLRFDGWVYVAAAKAGKWVLNYSFDDVLALALDGEWLFAHPTYRYGRTSGCHVSEGWHRFTVLAGDTGGGYGSACVIGSMKYPFVIAVNGGSNIAFTSDNFTFGSGASTVTLAGDCDWSALGEIRISNGTTIDLQGHNLTLSDMTSDYIGTVITNSAAKKSVMYFLDEPLESKACSEGLVKEVDVKIILAKDGDQVATWTGAVSGDPSNANNWEDLAGEPVVPTAAYTVKVAGGNVNLQAPAGTDIACKSFEIGNCTLTANCDWRGLSKTPVIVGTANLNGHNLTLNRLSAVAGATLTGGDGSAVAFVPDESATVAKLSETAYIDNIANLTLSGDAKILFRKKDGNGTLTVTEMLLGNSLRSEVAQSAGTVSLGDKIHKIGDVAGKTGVYTLADGTITTGGNSEFIIGSSGNGTFNMTGGTVTLGNWGSIARWANGNGTFNISGGTFNATKEGREIYMACANNTKGTLNASGNAILNLRGLWMGVWSSSTRSAYANFSENAVMNILGDIRIGSDTSTQGDITVRDNATINSTGAILLGRDGIGTLSLGGGTVNANSGVTIANGSGATGTLTLSGGVLNTKFLKKGGGKATTMFAGGKIVAKDASNAATFISGIGDVKYGAGGLTVDTAGYSVTMASNTVSYVSHGSALVKQGAGTLTVDALPPVDTVKVEGGTLALTADGDNAASASLAHRWSFNNDSKADSVTGDDATFTSTITFVDGMARIPGGAKNDNYIELGSNRLPSDSVTMEFWVTIRADAAWPKMFCLGASSSDVIGFTFHRDSNSGPSSIDVYPGGGMWTGTGTLTKDVPYYFAFTFLANPEDGSTVLKAYCVNTSTGALVGTINQTLANWRLAEKITQNMFRLGYSFWNDGAAQADYDEVRVWLGALSADAVALSATKGPDASADDIAAIVAKNGETVSADRTLAFAGGTLDLGGNTLHQSIVKSGGGTVRNGTLDITDRIVVNLADCIAGNCLAANGTIDFTGATLVLEDPEVLASHSSSITFVKSAAGGSVTFIGVPACELPKGWSISTSGGKARLMKEGFSIFVR